MKELFKKIYRRILSSNFLKSVLTLSSGVVVGQIINFLGMPIVGRVYTPEAMGDYTLITSNATIISGVACLGMMTSFMLPEKDEEARGLSRLVAYSTLGITTLLIGALWLCSDFFRIFETTKSSYSLSLIVLWLYIVFYTISNICYAYVNRRKLYKVMFWNPIITAGINVGASILFGWFGWGFLGYTAAHILSFGANIIHLTCYANAFEKVTDKEYKPLALLKSYRRFPVYQMPANLISNLGTQLPVQMIERLYSSHSLGMYSMALRILSLPVTLLATPVNRVFFREASERYNKGEDIGEFSFNILKTNIKIAILPIALLVIFGEWIFSVFLGTQWYEAGMFAAIMGLWQLLQFCSSCLSGSFVLIRKNKIELFLAIARLAVNILLFLFCRIFITNVLNCLMLVTLVNSVYELVQRGIFLKLTGLRLSKYLTFVLLYIVLPIALSWLIRIVIR